MIPKSIGGYIRFAAQPGLTLRGGEVVSLHVLNRLTDTKWAVGIQGKVFPAQTRLPLEPGTVLRARVLSAGSRLVLALQHPGDIAPGASPASRQANLGNPLLPLIAGSLLRSGQPALPDTVTRLKGLLSRRKEAGVREARSLATMLDKGIDISGGGTEKIMEALGFGAGGERGGRRYRGHAFPKDAAAARAAFHAVASGSSEQAGALAVYNHLKGRNQSWVVLPFLFADGEEEYSGTLKLLYDPFAGKPRTMVLTIFPDGRAPWSFHLAMDGRRRMDAFCADRDAARLAAGPFGELAAKLHNLGIELDDTIHGDGSFDGFSPIPDGEPAQGVDTVG